MRRGPLGRCWAVGLMPWFACHASLPEPPPDDRAFGTCSALPRGVHVTVWSTKVSDVPPAAWRCEVLRRFVERAGAHDATFLADVTLSINGISVINAELRFEARATTGGPGSSARSVGLPVASETVWEPFRGAPAVMETWEFSPAPWPGAGTTLIDFQAWLHDEARRARTTKAGTPGAAAGE